MIVIFLTTHQPNKDDQQILIVKTVLYRNKGRALDIQRNILIIMSQCFVFFNIRSIMYPRDRILGPFKISHGAKVLIRKLKHM